MTSAVFDKQALTETLAAQWGAFGELLGELPDDLWRAPTALPGWSVQDIVAHVIGTEEFLLGERPPETGADVQSLDHVHNDMAAFNEHWVISMREHSPDELRARYRDVIARRTGALSAMTQEDFDAPAQTPAGPGTYGRFMRIRLFDIWFHEQDIRDVLGRPGHEDGPCAELACAEIFEALGYLVGKKAGAPDGASVTIDLTGPLARTLHVAVEGRRASVVPELPGPATATVRLDSRLFVRLAGGRVDAERGIGEVAIEGDTDLGERVVRNLAFTI